MNLINLLLMLFFIYCIIIFSMPVQNFGVKGLSEHSLRDLSYRGIYFKCSNQVSDDMAFSALNNLLNNYSLYKNYNFVKYYKNDNGILIPFHRYSCYSHPNLYIGCFNEVLFNFQFTHKKINNNVLNFTEEDINNTQRQQFYFSNINFYHKSLSQIYLNKNNLYLNETYKSLNKNLINNETKKSIEIQNYICINCNGLNRIIKNSLKIQE